MEDSTVTGKNLHLDGKIITSDKSLGLVEIIPDFYPEAEWQCCTVHFYRRHNEDRTAA